VSRTGTDGDHSGPGIILSAVGSIALPESATRAIRAYRMNKERYPSVFA